MEFITLKSIKLIEFSGDGVGQLCNEETIEELLDNCSESALKMLWKCFINCSESALKTALKVF